MLALLLSAAFKTVANTRHNRLANAIILQDHLEPLRRRSAFIGDACKQAAQIKSIVQIVQRDGQTWQRTG
jgi:hypothetical protein